jgi:hypothetical protein
MLKRISSTKDETRSHSVANSLNVQYSKLVIICNCRGAIHTEWCS